MSERGLPIAEGAHACPFVAFEDDRDERATVPDHRHRCYAEVRPAPRALAHQEAYCLSSAFPVCPTFQDWARRESARARDAAAEAAAGNAPERGSHDDEADDSADDSAAAAAASAAAAAAALPARGGDLAASGAPLSEDIDDGPRRNPPRDWSAPPPWLASSEDPSRDPNASPPDFLARRTEPGAGLAGSPADRLAGGPPPRPAPTNAQAPAIDPLRDHDAGPTADDAARTTPAAPPRRPRAYEQHLGGPSTGPDWERPRRYEAYPAIRTRIGIPALPTGPLAIGALAVVIAALALFFLPAILGLGSGDQTTTSPSPSVAPSQSVAPTAVPAPTPIIYTIKKGETLSKIATAHGITLEQLMAANPDIKNPDRISEGQKITIPVPEAPNEFGSPSPSAEASP